MGFTMFFEFWKFQTIIERIFRSPSPLSKNIGVRLIINLMGVRRPPPPEGVGAGGAMLVLAKELQADLVDVHVKHVRALSCGDACGGRLEMWGGAGLPGACQEDTSPS